MWPQAKVLGDQVILVMIHLENAQLNQARIAERIAEGGQLTRHLNRLPAWADALLDGARVDFRRLKLIGESADSVRPQGQGRPLIEKICASCRPG